MLRQNNNSSVRTHSTSAVKCEMCVAQPQSHDTPASTSVPEHICRWRNSDALGEQITARSLQTKRRDEPARVVKFMLFWQNKRRMWKKPRRGVFWSERLKSGHAPPGHEVARVCLCASVSPEAALWKESILNCNSKCKEGPSQSQILSSYKNVELTFTWTLNDYYS